MSEWYRDFFQGETLAVWRQAMTPRVTAAEARAIAGWLRPPRGGRLLDVPCGNGRLAVALAKRGYALTGIDLAGDFIAEARQASARAGVEIDWRQDDMREIPAEPPFDGAFCFGNSFGYLPPSGTARFAAALAGALKPGARFVLDTAMSAESVLPNLEQRLWHPVGDRLMLVEHDYVAAESRLDTTYTFIHEGRTETRHAEHFIHTVAETRRFFETAGFDTVALHGTLDGEPFAVGGHQLYALFERR